MSVAVMVVVQKPLISTASFGFPKQAGLLPVNRYKVQLIIHFLREM